MGSAVAPRFEAARKLLVANVEGGRVVEKKTVLCEGTEGHHRIRALQMHGVGVLICSGIKGSYRDMLTASGVTVIPNVSDSAEKALEMFIDGSLVPDERDPDDMVDMDTMSHESLVEHARGLFTSHGYAVSEGPGEDAFMIDLVAEISCPICRRPVRVAVCCGAHTYRCKQEIFEFHLATQTDYQARAYYCPARPAIEKCCKEYDIELIDAEAVRVPGVETAFDKIPLLRGPITDHEKASWDAE